jgi:hypothetical protein
MNMSAAELIKDGSSVNDTLLNVGPEKLVCEKCGASYSLHYSSGLVNELKNLIAKSKTAVNGSHPNHPPTLSLPGV